MMSMNLSSYVNVSRCSECYGDTEYYCLTCEKNLCPTCKMEHSIHLDTTEHNIILYKYKNRAPCTREPCEKHPKQVYEMYCKVCDIPLCVDCKDSKEHNIVDIMTVFEEKKEIINACRDTLYNLQVKRSIIEHDFKLFKNEKETLISDIVRKLQKVKDYLDTIPIVAQHTFEKNEYLLLRKIQNQISTMSKHLSKINLFEKMPHAHKPVQLVRFMKKARFPDIKKMPVHVQHVLLSPTEVDMQGLINLLNIKMNKRDKSNVKNQHLLKLILEPEIQESFFLKHFASCEHISCVTGNQAWISQGTQIALIEITTGKYFHMLDDAVSGFWWGLHTVNGDRELFYISKENSVMKLSYDRKSATIFLGNFHPSCQLRSLYCSKSTGDLLIGMHILDQNTHDEIGIVARYNKDGQLTMTIPDVHTKHALFEDPNYITENTNGDVVVSDYWHGVVVTDHEGKHLFTYKDTPFGSRLLPRGICTDALSHILVCDCYTETIQILNKEGNFLFYILAQKAHGSCGKPCSLSFDSNAQLLWVGSWNNTLSRYSHIKRPFISSDSREICIENSCEVPSCFSNPMHCEGLNSFFSVLKRLIDDIIRTPEEQASEADFVKVTFNKMFPKIFNEFMKTVTSRALKYHISEDEASLDIMARWIPKMVECMHESTADDMIRNKESGDGDFFMEYKVFLFEFESYILNIVHNRDFLQVFKQIVEDKDAVEEVTELVRERIEIIKTTFNNGSGSLTESRAVCKDVYNLVMDVLSHFNQARETTFVKHITEKE